MHILSPNNDRTVVLAQQPIIFSKNPHDCWQGYKYIPCAEIFNGMIPTSNATTTQPLITTLSSVLNDTLPHSKSSFFQQYQFIIFIAVIVLCTGLIILTLFVLIFVLIQTRRQKTNSVQSNRWDDDESLFEWWKQQQKKFGATNRDKNTNLPRGNTIKHHLNKNDVEPMPFYYECTTLPPPAATLPTKTAPNQ